MAEDISLEFLSPHLFRVHQGAAQALQAHSPHRLVAAGKTQVQGVVHGLPRNVLGGIWAVEKLGRGWHHQLTC